MLELQLCVVGRVFDWNALHYSFFFSTSLAAQAVQNAVIEGAFFCITCRYLLPCSCTHLSGCCLCWVLFLFLGMFLKDGFFCYHIRVSALFDGTGLLLCRTATGGMQVVCAYLVHQELYFSKLYFGMAHGLLFLPEAISCECIGRCI